jgi:hypothetical protein
MNMARYANRPRNLLEFNLILAKLISKKTRDNIFFEFFILDCFEIFYNQKYKINNF